MSEREVSRWQRRYCAGRADENGKDSSSHWGSENKVKKRGTFFDSQKMTAKTPRHPDNSPCCHHDFTIAKHPKTQKTPSKPHLHHTDVFSRIKPQFLSV